MLGRHHKTKQPRFATVGCMCGKCGSGLRHQCETCRPSAASTDGMEEQRDVARRMAAEFANERDVAIKRAADLQEDLDEVRACAIADVRETYAREDAAIKRAEGYRVAAKRLSHHLLKYLRKCQGEFARADEAEQKLACLCTFDDQREDCPQHGVSPTVLMEQRDEYAEVLATRTEQLGKTGDELADALRQLRAQPPAPELPDFVEYLRETWADEGRDTCVCLDWGDCLEWLATAPPATIIAATEGDLVLAMREATEWCDDPDDLDGVPHVCALLDALKASTITTAPDAPRVATVSYLNESLIRCKTCKHRNDDCGDCNVGIDQGGVTNCSEYEDNSATRTVDAKAVTLPDPEWDDEDAPRKCCGTCEDFNEACVPISGLAACLDYRPRKAAPDAAIDNGKRARTEDVAQVLRDAAQCLVARAEPDATAVEAGPELFTDLPWTHDDSGLGAPEIRGGGKLGRKWKVAEITEWESKSGAAIVHRVNNWDALKAERDEARAEVEGIQFKLNAQYAAWVSAEGELVRLKAAIVPVLEMAKRLQCSVWNDLPDDVKALVR